MTDPVDYLRVRLLVLRAQTGDAAAFAELVDMFGPRLRYYLRKMLGDGPAADDALQDVWLDALRALPRLLDAAAFTAWLYRIARHRAARAFRRPRAAQRPLAETDWIDDAAERDDWSAEDAAAVHAALDDLSAGHREVLVLRFLEALSYDEIAGVVGCQVGTVRSRIHYGKAALRRALTARCEP